MGGSCVCKNCGKTRTGRDGRGGRTLLNHRWDVTPLKCGDCGIEAPQGLSRLAEGIEALSISAAPDDVILRSLKQAVQAAAHKIEYDFPDGIASFRLGHFRLPDMVESGWFESSVSNQEVELTLHFGNSELRLTIRKHGADTYSLREYRYNQSDDDGGHGRYL